MSVDSKMKKICNNIRLRTGGTALLDLDEIAEAIMQIGWETDPKAKVYHTIGTTFPPSQKPADADYAGYDIDIYSSKADDVFAYIDNAANGKSTVTKEILGKDASGKYDIARYTYAKREYCAWVRQNYPKMYAWKNGNTIKYTESVSPRINDKAYDTPYVVESGTSTETTTIPARAVIYEGYRYSHSGAAFKAESTTSAIIVPLPAEGVSQAVVTLTGMSKHKTYTGCYGGTVPDAYPAQVQAADPWSNDGTTVTVPNGGGSLSGIKFIVFFVKRTGTSGEYNGTSLTVNGNPVELIVGNPSDARQESTTTTEVESESGTPITAVSATRRSRTIGGVEYVRYEGGDIEPTVIYTDIDNSRNSNASITQDGVTYKRYPLGDLGANREKLIPIFIFANVHGQPKTINYAPPAGDGQEGAMPALIASRFLRDLANDKQENSILYKYIRENCMVIVIPVANPFGFNYHLTSDTNKWSSGYYNANGVNINRNHDTPGWDVMNTAGNDAGTMGAYAGSEIETQYIMNTMVESGAAVAMSLHGFWGWKGYCLHQGQNPNPHATSDADKYVDYNQDKLAKVNTFLQTNWGYTLRYYDMSNGEPVRVNNTPDKTSKDPSFITQCGAYGGIIEFTEDDIRSSEFKIEHNGYPEENAYAQMLNLMAMWLSDYLDNA